MTVKCFLTREVVSKGINVNDFLDDITEFLD